MGEFGRRTKLIEIGRVGLARECGFCTQHIDRVGGPGIRNGGLTIPPDLDLGV